MEFPALDQIAVAAFVAAPLEPLGDVGKRGEAGLGKHPAGVGRATADPADHIDRGLHIDSFGYL